MCNLDVMQLNEIDSIEKERLKMSQMLIDKLGVPASKYGEDLSEDSDDERDTKYNILDAEDGGIEEEDECAECDDCCQNDDSSDELPLIRDVDRSKFRHIDPNDSLLNDSAGSWDITTGASPNLLTKQASQLKQGKYHHYCAPSFHLNGKTDLQTPAPSL